MTTVLLDSHVVHWWSAEPHRVSGPASAALRAADELAVAAISWFELAWLAHHERITVVGSVRAWIDQLASRVRTMAITPAIAVGAVTLPSSFPGEPADRLIFATAVEHGFPLVKDHRLRRHHIPARSLFGDAQKAGRASQAPGPRRFMLRTVRS